jgi:hypothetical protein
MGRRDDGIECRHKMEDDIFKPVWWKKTNLMKMPVSFYKVQIIYMLIFSAERIYSSYI